MAVVPGAQRLVQCGECRLPGVLLSPHPAQILPLGEPNQFWISSKKMFVSRRVALRNEMMRISFSLSVWTIDTAIPASSPSVTKRYSP
jgi:hypothetical protein